MSSLQKHEYILFLKKKLNFQDRLNEIRRMVSKEKGIRTAVLPSPQPEPEQSTSGASSEKSIN